MYNYNWETMPYFRGVENKTFFTYYAFVYLHGFCCCKRKRKRNASFPYKVDS